MHAKRGIAGNTGKWDRSINSLVIALSVPDHTIEHIFLSVIVQLHTYVHNYYEQKHFFLVPHQNRNVYVDISISKLTAKVFVCLSV